MKKLIFFTAAIAINAMAYGQYCTLNLYDYGCSSSDDIDDFTLGPFSHPGTGCSSGGYDDYTSQTIQLVPGAPYNLNVTSNYSSQTLKIFVDFNSDQDFNDAGEEIFASTNTYGSGTPLNSTVTIPASTPPGVYTLRARGVFSNTSFTACSNENFGEVHDYTLSVLGGCPDPTDLAVDIIRCDSVKMSWNSTILTLSSTIEWGAAGFVPGNGNVINTTMDSVYVGGLSPNTSYDFHITDYCDDDTSAYTGPFTFNTGSKGAPTASFKYSFQGATASHQAMVFHSTSNNSHGATHEWYFGDGDSAVGYNALHHYKLNGDWDVMLVVSNACGSDTAIQTITSEGISLQEMALNNSLEIYPNPANDYITVAFDALEGASEVNIHLQDAQGRIVREERRATTKGRFESSLHTGDLAPGIYLIEVSTADATARQRVMIRR